MEELRPVFDQTLEDNKPQREEMVRLICSSEAIAFVGSGLSANPILKYPSWSDLLEKLREAANSIAHFSFSEQAKGNLLLMAEEIRAHFESRQRISDFNGILCREFGSRMGLQCSSTHDRLVKLPFKAFVTTNYDDCLTNALSDWRSSQGERSMSGIATGLKAPHMLSLFLRSLSAPFDSTLRRVVHLHGQHTDPDSFILTYSQYYSAYGFEICNGQRTNENRRFTIHSRLTWALLATRRMVFFGCSMDDPYIMEMLEIVASDLWESRQSIHFIVLPLDEQSVVSASDKISKFKKYGLEVVFYDNWDGLFLKLDHLLDIASDSNSEAVASRSAPPAPNAALNLHGPDQANAGQVPPIQVAEIETIPLSWLDEVNDYTTQDLKK